MSASWDGTMVGRPEQPPRAQATSGAEITVRKCPYIKKKNSIHVTHYIRLRQSYRLVFDQENYDTCMRGKNYNIDFVTD